MNEEETYPQSISSQPVANCDQFDLSTPIESCIFTIRGQQVLVDRDLAVLYGVETKVLNQSVKRNIARFPERFRFQLSKEETNELVTNCDRFASLKHSSVFPYVFTEQGIAMLSSVLRSDTAVAVSIRIMDAFVAMRRFIVSNAQLFQRVDRLEMNQLETNHKIDEIFKQLEDKKLNETQGIFFDGQIFDAYAFMSKLIKEATQSVILIDNYVDESVLTMLDKRTDGVSATIYTHTISHQLQLDLNRYNAQNPTRPIAAQNFRRSHDRFLCIDDKVYHIGASLKDLGKKWFAFSLMEDLTPAILIGHM